MKIQYRSVTGIIEIEIDEEWGNRVLELDRADYNSDRRDHRTDHKYHRGTTITVEDAESEEYAGLKRQRGQIKSDELLNCIIRNEEHAKLHYAVDKLPVDQRELVKAVFFDGVKAVDYARAKGVSKAAVSQKLTRALKNLKKLLS